MAEDTVILPTNAVAFGGPVKRRSKKVKTVTGLRKGLLVEYDTDSSHIKRAGAGVIHGLLGWLEDIIPATGIPWNNDADPVAEDPCSVVRGYGAHVKGKLASGENVKEGDLLISAANGEVAKAANLAIPAGGVAVTSTGANPALTGSAPPGGRIVGVALHDVDATAEAKDIGIESWI